MGAEYASGTSLQLWGAENDGILQGLAGVEVEDSHVVLRDLAVAPDLRSTGVGSFLIAFLVEKYPNLTITGLTLTESIRFYPRVGVGIVEDGSLPSGETRLRRSP